MVYMNNNIKVSIIIFLITIFIMFIFDIMFRDPNKKFCIKEFIFEKGLIALMTSIILYMLNNYTQSSNKELLHSEGYDEVPIKEP
jgi:hypothetical protein